MKHIFEAETQLPGVTALDHGQQSEPAATEDYMSAMQRLGHSGLEVFRVGLCLHPDHEYVAGSPLHVQLGVTGLTWCDFVIWAGPGRMSIERIDFDPVFWEETVLMPLIHFSLYMDHIPSRQPINRIHMHTNSL